MRLPQTFWKTLERRNRSALHGVRNGLGCKITMLGTVGLKKEVKVARFRRRHRHCSPHIAVPDLPAGVRDHLANVCELPRTPLLRFSVNRGPFPLAPTLVRSPLKDV